MKPTHVIYRGQVMSYELYQQEMEEKSERIAPIVRLQNMKEQFNKKKKWAKTHFIFFF